MARNDHDKVALGAMLHGLRTRRAACAHCGSQEIRRSGRPPSSLMRLLGLRPFRCERCWRLFVLRQACSEGF